MESELDGCAAQRGGVLAPPLGVGSDFDFYEGVILRKRSDRRIQRMFARETQYLPIQHLLDSSLRYASFRMTQRSGSRNRHPF